MEETLSNSQFIAFHRNQPNPEPLPKSTLTFAYGDFKYNKMCAEMKTTDNILKEKVLKEINEDYHQADKINFSLESGLLDECIKCFRHTNNSIRELASHAVLLSCATEMGRAKVVEDDLVVPIGDLFDDEVTKIRDNAYGALLNLAEFTFGIKAIIDKDILPILVEKLVAEKEESIVILVLKLLNILLEGELATGLVLNTPVIRHLNHHLKSKNHEIRNLSAESLGSISYDEVGKLAVLESDSVEPLSGMLTDQITFVRTASVRALTSLAQIKEGKVQIYDLDKLNTIIMLLYDVEEQTRLNTIQLISMVAEYPPAREKFKQALEKLNEMAR